MSRIYHAYIGRNMKRTHYFNLFSGTIKDEIKKSKILFKKYLFNGNSLKVTKVGSLRTSLQWQIKSYINHDTKKYITSEKIRTTLLHLQN